MTLSEIIEKLDTIRSKEDIVYFAKKLSLQPDFVTSLWEIIRGSSDQIATRAAWLLDYALEKNPSPINDFLAIAIPELEKIKNKGVLRSLVRILSRSTIPIEFQMLLMDQCISYLLNSEMPVAIKVHAMQVAYHISQDQFELKSELIHVLEDAIEKMPTPGMSSRGNKLIYQLTKEIATVK